MNTGCPMTPYLSVIVPVHDAADSLNECLTAIAASDLPRECWELIVVDDGSTDDSALIEGSFANRWAMRASASGCTWASASRKTRHSPVATSKPRFRA